jgi:hypothetical protein
VSQRNSNNSSFVAAVFILLAIMAVGEIVACRGMYADGPNMLINMLHHGDFLLFEPHRIIHTFLTQTPVVLGLRLGLMDLPTYRYIYSTALLFWPLLFWAVALYVARRDVLFWPLVMLFCFVHFNFGFFAISELNLCVALTACCIACIGRTQPMNGFEYAIMTIVALLYPLEYAATLFFGPVLFIGAAVRLWQAKGFWRKLYWLFIGLCFLAAAATGVWEVMTPRDPGNFESARDWHILLVDGRFWNLLLFGALMNGTIVFTGARFTYWAQMACALLITAIVLNLSAWEPSYAYSIRMYMALAILPNIAFLLWFRIHIKRSPAVVSQKARSAPVYALPVFALFIILSLMDVALSVHYAQFLDAFQSEVNASTGYIPYEQSKIRYDSNERLFFGSWTHITLSMVLRDNPDKGIILNPSWYHGYQGLDDPNVITDITAFYPK